MILSMSSKSTGAWMSPPFEAINELPVIDSDAFIVFTYEALAAR